MKKIDIRISKDILKRMIGKKFNKYVHDPFSYSNSVYSVVDLFIDNKVYQIKNELNAMDYYGIKEDIALWNIYEVSKSQVQSGLVGVKQIDTVVNEMINSITLIEEKQVLVENGKITYEIELTRSIIFHTKSRDYSFEKDDCAFSEQIEINRGNDLVKLYPKQNNFFLTEWSEGIEAQCLQSIVSLNLE